VIFSISRGHIVLFHLKGYILSKSKVSGSRLEERSGASVDVLEREFVLPRGDGNGPAGVEGDQHSQCGAFDEDNRGRLANPTPETDSPLPLTGSLAYAMKMVTRSYRRRLR
jgi:hypothetical protein